MPRKTGSRTGARSAASSAGTRTWLFRWFQRARGPHARQTLVRSAPSPRKRSAAGRGMGQGALREGAPHPIEIMATPLCPLPVVSAFTRVFNALWRGEGTCRADGLRAALTGLRDDNLGKRTIARRGRAKRRHWRDANGDMRKTNAGGPGPPAAQVLPRSISLPAQGLPAALHQDGCDAQANGGPTRERKERDPHGVPRSVVDFASIVS